MSAKVETAVQRILVVAATAGALVLPAIAAAQETGAALEEIVVTAQKREQALKDVPITVSVVNEEAIRNNGATTFDKLIPRIPGISGFTTGVATSVWAIRGLSSNTSGSGGEPSVGFYQDEAFAGYIEYASFPLFDSNRVEVAKGPQGTLFGKNATAGAILVYTNRPEPSAWAFNADVGFGNYGQQRVQAAINLPAGERFALRLSGMYEHLDDWQTNMIIPGDEGGGMERTAGRLGAYWQITDSLDAYLFIQKYKGDSNQWLTNDQKLTGDTDPEHVYSVIPESIDHIEVQGAYLSLDWRVDDRLTIKSITDYRELPEYRWEADGVAAPQATVRALAQAALGVPINAILGVQGPLGNQGKNFASHMFQQELRGSWQGDGMFIQGGANYVRYSESRPMQAAAINVDLGGFRWLHSSGWESTRESYGIFVDGAFDVTPDLTVTAGVRYSNDKSDFLALAQGYQYSLPAPGAIGTYPQEYFSYTTTRPSAPFCAFSLTSPKAPCLGAGVPADRADDAFTPRIALTYRLSDSTNLYANYARGFKAGGFDVVVPSPTTVNQFDPENVDAFDVGLKGQTATLRYGASLFYNKYKDLQVSAIVNAVSRTANAASAVGKGFEGELTWVPNDMWEISANYTYLSAKYTEGTIALGSTPISADGLNLIRSPENTFNLLVAFSVPLGGLGTLRIAPVMHYQDEMELNFANRADMRQPSYTRVDARISLSPASGNWDVAVVGENLSKAKIINRMADLVGFGPQVSYQPVDPMYRLEVGVRFGGSK